MILDQICQPNDIKKINPGDYDYLAQEIRDFLIRRISVTGGHLGSNLGAVEPAGGQNYLGCGASVLYA